MRVCDRLSLPCVGHFEAPVQSLDDCRIGALLNCVLELCEDPKVFSVGIYRPNGNAFLSGREGVPVR